MNQMMLERKKSVLLNSKLWRWKNTSEQLTYHLISALLLQETVMFHGFTETGKKEPLTTAWKTALNSLMLLTCHCNFSGPIPSPSFLFMFYTLASSNYRRKPINFLFHDRRLLHDTTASNYTHLFIFTTKIIIYP